MLWYKGWLETQFRFLFLLGFALLFFTVVATRNADSASTAAERLTNLAILWFMGAVMLAGAGINTQVAFRATRGLHGSMYFTLSLPVSRLRLLAIRAGVGLVEMVGVFGAGSCAAWIIFPALRADLFAYWMALSVCCSAFYFLSVLLATFLDDLWQIWGSAIVILILRWFSTEIRVPSPLNIFQAIGHSSPLFTHTLPWASMGVSLGASAILFAAALKAVQLREY